MIWTKPPINSRFHWIISICNFYQLTSDKEIFFEFNKFLNLSDNLDLISFCFQRDICYAGHEKILINFSTKFPNLSGLGIPIDMSLIQATSLLSKLLKLKHLQFNFLKGFQANVEEVSGLCDMVRNLNCFQFKGSSCAQINQKLISIVECC